MFPKAIDHQLKNPNIWVYKVGFRLATETNGWYFARYCVIIPSTTMHICRHDISTLKSMVNLIKSRLWKVQDVIWKVKDLRKYMKSYSEPLRLHHIHSKCEWPTTFVQWSNHHESLEELYKYSSWGINST